MFIDLPDGSRASLQIAQATTGGAVRAYVAALLGADPSSVFLPRPVKDKLLDGPLTEQGVEPGELFRARVRGMNVAGEAGTALRLGACA